jgi:DNA-binding NarL/FixJ family response regulator
VARHPSSVLLVSPPGPVRDGLAALLAAVPGLALAAEAGDLESALHGLAAAPPDAIVLDGAAAQPDLAGALNRLRSAAPLSGLLVLADDVAQLDGAGDQAAVLLKGAPAADLLAALERLLV